MAEFQWWLLLVGLVAGGGLVAVVFLDGARREQDLEETELPAEAQLIALRLASRGRGLDPHDVEAVLREHREYKLLPPPDRLDPVDPPEADAAALAATRSASHQRVRQPAEPASQATNRAEPPTVDV
jgi:hypothetical protein